MRAVRFEQYGGIDVLTVGEIPTPAPGPGEVLVQLKAAGINPGEAKICDGLLHERWPATFPSGQGSDLAGVVAGLGAGATEATVVGLAGQHNHDWLAAHGVVPVAYGDGVADRIRRAAPRVDAFIDTFGGDYVQLALDLGVTAERIDTIANFTAVRQYGVKGHARGKIVLMP